MILARFFQSRKAKLISALSLLAKLSNKYNAFHEKIYEVESLERKFPAILINQFVSASKKHTDSAIRVGYWRLQESQIYESFKGLRDFKKVSNDSGSEIDFYFPLDLQGEYPGVVEALGKPDDTFDAYLTPSGRSLWVLRNSQLPVCLKLDTMQLSSRMHYSERLLNLSALRYSVAMSSMLKNEKNIFFEDKGYLFEFDFNDQDGVSKKYIYLIRELDPSRSDLKPGQLLIPLPALASEEFWANRELQASLSLNGKANHFWSEGIARCLAPVIYNSLFKTHVHFELHMQNISITCSNGKPVNAVYHDLQDAFFDPVTCFLQKIQDAGDPSQARLLGVFGDFLKNLNEIVGASVINLNGSLISTTTTWPEWFNVTCFYRRYIRNFGNFNSVSNFFTGEDYLFSKTFEEHLLKNLNLLWPAADHSGVDPFLAGDLFWNIDYQYTRLQRSLLNHFIQTQSRFFTEIPYDDIMPLIKRRFFVVSKDFPIHKDMINPQKISRMLQLESEQLFIVFYDGAPALLILLGD